MRAFQSSKMFAAVAALFALATAFNASQDRTDTAGKGRLVVPVEAPAPIDVKLKPAVPASPWNADGKES